MRLRHLALFALVALIPACSDGPTAKRVLAGQGYRSIETTGHRWIGCSEHDDVRTGFKAIGADGQPVTGVVCGSVSIFGKSNTVRVD